MKEKVIYKVHAKNTSDRPQPQVKCKTKFFSRKIFIKTAIYTAENSKNIEMKAVQINIFSAPWFQTEKYTYSIRLYTLRYYFLIRRLRKSLQHNHVFSIIRLFIYTMLIFNLYILINFCDFFNRHSTRMRF